MNCSFFWSFHVSAFFLIQYFPKKTSFFSKFSTTNESHADFFLCQYLYVFAVGSFFCRFGVGWGGGTFHVLAFFQMLLILLFICLFGMIYVLFGVHTNEKIKIRAIDVCVNPTHNFDACHIHIKWANVFLVVVKSRMNFMAFFSVLFYVVTLCMHV